METMVSKTFKKVMGILGCIFLTTMSGVFAMLSLFALVMSIVDKCVVSVMGCIAAALIAIFMWSVRKDTLV